MAYIPKYRRRNPRRSTSDGPSRPKAYTVNEESRFVLIRNIPALGASEDLVAQCRKYGEVEDFRMEDDHDDASQYIDVMWLQYATVDAARQAKAFHIALKMNNLLTHAPS
ncbi:RNA-binding protein 48 [Aphanomyces cochlioides]|nr:RNA-binding protein 48 [Aphanomyces cochlioides]